MSYEALDYLFEPVVTFCTLLVLFAPIEKLFPANPSQKFFRSNWGTDFCFFLGQQLLFVSLVHLLLSHFEGWIDIVIPSSLRENIYELPFVYQIILVILLSDFLIYWAHRLQHRIDFLWKFHSIHHTSEELDWLASFREHPLDSVYTVTIINLPAMILGFPLHTIAAFVFFRGIWAMFIHSNIKLPLGPFKYILGSPQIHHWHHAKKRDVGNYANLSPLMDILFGTFYCPKNEPDSLGVQEKSAKNYLGHMIYPFTKRIYSKGNSSPQQLLKSRQIVNTNNTNVENAEKEQA